MSVEWQGDHKLLDASGEKQDFERELTRLGFEPSKFLVEVRQRNRFRWSSTAGRRFT